MSDELKPGRAEIERAVDVLTTNETYLFREEYQLRAFQREVLPLLYRRGEKTRRLSIWSAGCSTGEEVYTIAILIKESRMFEGWDVRIIGNDISRRVLTVARRGSYGPSSFRSMPESYKSFFIETPEGSTVRPDIRAMCSFAHLNLLDSERYSVVGMVDAIFCRNVMIYFNPALRERVHWLLHGSLTMFGVLGLGMRESLRFTPLQDHYEELESGVRLYRRVR